MVEMPEFLQELAEGAASSGNFTKDVVTINMVNFTNHGNIMIIPFNGKNGETPIRQLNRVGEIDKIVTGTTKEGVPYSRTVRLKLFLNPKYYGDLSPEDMKEYEVIKSKFNMLLQKGWKGARTKDYTLIQGFCIEHTDKTDKVLHKECACFVIISSKNFTKAFNSSIEGQTKLIGDPSWIRSLCNSELERKRFINIKLIFNQGEGGGYTADVKLGKFDEDMYRYTNKKDFYDLTKYKEFLEQLGNPINKFCDIPVDVPTFDRKYIDELHGHINACLMALNGEDTQQVDRPAQQPDTYQANPGAPADMTPSAPEEAPVAADDDDLPF